MEYRRTLRESMEIQAGVEAPAGSDFPDLDHHFHAAVGGAFIGADHGRHVVVIPADGEFHIPLVRECVVGGIEADPSGAGQIDLTPRVGRLGPDEGVRGTIVKYPEAWRAATPIALYIPNMTWV